jgi:hypothetical protein
MNIELLAPLVLLALVDSTSFGTLLIPLWLMSVPDRPRPGRIVLFLCTVAAFYLLLGIALLLGASMLLDTLRETGNSQPIRIAQLVLGVGFMALGVQMAPWTKAGKERRVARRAEKLAVVQEYGQRSAWEVHVDDVVLAYEFLSQRNWVLQGGF